MTAGSSGRACSSRWARTSCAPPRPRASRRGPSTSSTRCATRCCPVVTNIGLEIPFLFTGAIITETIFSWPGIGKLTIDATRSFDYPILMGVFLVTAILVVFANLIADVTYGVVDPRIKY